MREFEIDALAQACLIGSKSKLVQEEELDNPALVDEVRHRILTINFDCTPNWGIHGIRAANNVPKKNWYLRDPEVAETARERYNNLDITVLKEVLGRATKDVLGENFCVVGFGIYGSYIYRRGEVLPGDLDVLILADGAKEVAVDALRYRSSDLRGIYKNPGLITTSTDELGLSVVSVDSFNPKNVSYIVTDCALLDISTTISHDLQVDAAPLPPYILIQNAMKIVRWGVSVLLDKPQTLVSRMDEALRMRQMLVSDNRTLCLADFPKIERLPTDTNALAKIGDAELIERARIMLHILEEDEQRIRQSVAASISITDR